MAKKSAFEDRSPREMIEESDHLILKYSTKNLVNNIIELTSLQALQIATTSLVPLEFRRGTRTMKEASARFWKYGKTIQLNLPKNPREAIENRIQPYKVINDTIENDYRILKDNDFNFIGISWTPIEGPDKRPRILRFIDIPRGARLFAYSEKMAGGIEVVLDNYSMGTVDVGGATILCRVPSEEEKRDRYVILFRHYPITDSDHKRVYAWSLRTEAGESGEPMSKTIDKLRYSRRAGETDVVTFDSKDVAANIAIIGKSWRENSNLVPLEMNILPICSKLGYEFAEKLNNNVMIYDPTLQSKFKYRNLHVDEKSLLFGKFIKKVGVNKSIYWDWERDGKIKDYFTVSS